jgi:hypothetical protein
VPVKLPKNILDGGALAYRQCGMCKRYLTPDKFYKGSNSFGLQGRCKTCCAAQQARDGYKSENHRFKRYGLTPEQYDFMLWEQDSKCAICGTDYPGKNGWHVDHSHVTGEVRGLLCTGCNTGIGALKDDPAVLRAAADYLERTSLLCR